ncbi:MAG: 4'-phosphopantetheinyl transferase superfamily protein [Alphaproteobacteria bacterium]|nr:4'-phosphopantetheinyl transferase superfamily protein [Alphaproteobacteria bacterium]
MESNHCFSLKFHEVHIWSACLSANEASLPYFASILSRDEQERANDFKFSRDQKRYTISRGILRSLLAGYLGELPHKIEILYGLWGKPCLPEEKVLSFNLSHSGDYALYAFTQRYEVGIDVEYIDESLELEEMARNVFSAIEWSDWEGLNEQEKIHSFFKQWVSKEAYLKASGKGWLESKHVLTLTKTNDLKQELRSNLPEEVKIIYPYYFESFPGYASALFVEGPSLKPVYYIWEKDFPCKLSLSATVY